MTVTVTDKGKLPKETAINNNNGTDNDNGTNNEQLERRKSLRKTDAFD